MNVEQRNRINEGDKKKTTLLKMFKNNQKREFPLSARYRNTNGKINNETGTTSRATNNSPTMPVKFEQPVKLTSILSNATQDLNKAENMSQLVSYKLVSGVEKQQQQQDKSDDVNIYTIQPSKTTEPPPPTTIDTLDSLQTVEKCISQMEAKAIQQKNIQKFLELCKSIKPDTKSDVKDKSQELNPKPPTNNQPPLKSFNEVEDLLKPGVSDMEAEYSETFDRTSKTRNSTSGAERADRTMKSKPLSRAASDAQDHNNKTGVGQKTTTIVKAKPRHIRNNVSQQVHNFMLCWRQLRRRTR